MAKWATVAYRPWEKSVPVKYMPVAFPLLTDLNLARLPIPPHPHVCDFFEFTTGSERGAVAVAVAVLDGVSETRPRAARLHGLVSNASAQVARVFANGTLPRNPLGHIHGAFSSACSRLAGPAKGARNPHHGAAWSYCKACRGACSEEPKRRQRDRATLPPGLTLSQMNEINKSDIRLFHGPRLWQKNASVPFSPVPFSPSLFSLHR